jgi:hypothetical protein
MADPAGGSAEHVVADPFDLSGRLALVTGSTRGIGATGWSAAGSVLTPPPRPGWAA